jgi:hypothetical protein
VPVFGPCGLTRCVVLRPRGDGLTPLQLIGKRRGGGRWTRQASRFVTAKMQRGGHDRGSDQGESDRAADRRQIEKTAAHQWNICAEPGW